MRIAYLDVFAGISGDMTLGALLDAGVPIEALRSELAKIPMEDWRLEATRAVKAGISGTRALVTLESDRSHSHEQGHTGHEGHGHDHDHDHGGARGDDHGHDHDHGQGHGHTHGDGHAHEGHRAHEHGRSCRELVDIIEASSLDASVVKRSTEILWRIARAEAKIHDKPAEEVHFHELGGLDSIIDIVGAVVGFDLLGVDEIVCSPLPVSHGFVDCAHGRLPVPAPATAELLRGVPSFPVDINGETVTPTGAAIAVGLAHRVGPFPAMRVEAIGYGCGRKDFPGTPNVLRLFVGERSGAMPGIEGGEGSFGGLISDRIKVIEANIDDMSPELYGRAVERAFEAGAADVWMTPIYMKKGRPATQLSAAVDPGKVEAVVAALLQETTTFGVRIGEFERRCLPRVREIVETEYGPITVKVGMIGARVVTASPEYADCEKAAREHGVAVKEVFAAASTAVRMR